MGFTKSIIISAVLHTVVLAIMLFRIDWQLLPKNKTTMPIEARLVIKNKDKNLLPKKPKKLPEALVPPQAEDKPVDKAKPQEANAKKPAETAKKITKNVDYMKALSSLSHSFARDVATKEEPEPDAEEALDVSYFDQIYSLIKASFVVPPHINGPQGRNLQASIRIYLASDGRLTKLNLVTPSGDEHFDNAVTQGAERVNNFGPVPIFLQSMLQERGILVDLCPFKCAER